MSDVITAVCGRCLHRVDAVELNNAEKKCDHCRGLAAGDEPAMPAVEDLHAGGHALLDERDFNGGHGPECDEL